MSRPVRTRGPVRRGFGLQTEATQPRSEKWVMPDERRDVFSDDVTEDIYSIIAGLSRSCWSRSQPSDDYVGPPFVLRLRTNAASDAPGRAAISQRREWPYSHER